jgi:hypothetical protein
MEVFGMRRRPEQIGATPRAMTSLRGSL